MMVWLDLETSALDPEHGVIMEIAAIAVGEDDLKEVGRWPEGLSRGWSRWSDSAISVTDNS